MSEHTQGVAIAGDRAVRLKFLCFEVGALSSLHIPNLVFALATKEHEAFSEIFGLNAIYRLIIDLPWLALYLFVLFTCGEPLAKFGIVPLRWKRDFVPFLCLLPLLLLQLLGTEQMVHHRLLDVRYPTTQFLSPIWLVLIVSLTIGAFQEVAFRGYLIPRLEELTGKTWIAVVGQAIFCAVTHFMFGTESMLAALIFSLASGMVFAKWRSLIPLILVQTIANFMAIQFILSSFVSE